MTDTASYRRVLVNVTDRSGLEDRVARGLRDAGCEVVYTQTDDPAALAINAVQEDVETLITPYTEPDQATALVDELGSYNREDLEIVLTAEKDAGDTDAAGDYMTASVEDAIRYVSRSYRWEDLDQVGDALAAVLDDADIEPVDATATGIEDALEDAYSSGQAAYRTEQIVEHNSSLFTEATG